MQAYDQVLLNLIQRCLRKTIIVYNIKDDTINMLKNPPVVDHWTDGYVQKTVQHGNSLHLHLHLHLTQYNIMTCDLSVFSMQLYV